MDPYMNRLAFDPLGQSYDQILVRYGEIGLKGKNRARFEERLMKNMRQALADLPSRWIDKTYGRLFVPVQGDAMEVLSRLRRVFGIVSLSGTIRVDNNLQAIQDGAQKVMQAQLNDDPTTFMVDTRRADKKFPHNSMDVNRLVGAQLAIDFPNLKVDLENPQIRIKVEMRSEGTYIYSRSIPGPGGLPLGVGGRGVLLLSGGIDSPVAAWMMMKRGLQLIPLHFHSFPFTSDRSKEKVIDLCKVLAKYAGQIPLVICHFTEIQKAIHKEIPADLRVTIMRRMMMRIAEKQSQAEGALAIVTGESLGQVASQTLESMYVINQVVAMPIFRPLVGMDKREIVDFSRVIGTYDISVRPYEDCCTVFLPKHPETRPGPERVLAVEERLAIDELVNNAMENLEFLEIS